MAFLLCGISLFQLSLPLALLRHALGRAPLEPDAGGGAPPASYRDFFPGLRRCTLVSSPTHAITASTPFRDDHRRVPEPSSLLEQQDILLYCDNPSPWHMDFYRQAQGLVLVLRHPVDAIAACGLLDQAMSPGRTAFSVESVRELCAQHFPRFLPFWNAHTSGFLALAGRLPIHVLRMEDLATDLPGTCAGLLDFLAARGCATPRPQAPDLDSLVAAALAPRAYWEPVARSVAPPPDLADMVEKACGPVLAAAGYAPEPRTMPASAPRAPEAEAIAALPFPGAYRNQALTFLRCRRLTVVHIPARSGSKRIPDKNVTPLGGLPLLAYSILVAKQLRGVDRIIVNTDSADYARIARQFGAETPFLRPGAISGDNASIGDAEDFLLHHLNVREGEAVGRLLTLYPTSPFRHPAWVQRLLDELATAPRVVTCFCVGLDMRRLAADLGGGPRLLRPEELGPDADKRLYKTTGSLAGASFIAARPGLKLHTLADPLELIDIDTKEDLAAAELVLSRNLYDFGFALPC